MEILDREVRAILVNGDGDDLLLRMTAPTMTKSAERLDVPPFIWYLMESNGWRVIYGSMRDALEAEFQKANQ